MRGPCSSSWQDPKGGAQNRPLPTVRTQMNELRPTRGGSRGRPAFPDWSSAVLAIHRVPLDLQCWSATVGLDPHLLAEYAEHWHQFDIWTQRVEQARALHRSQVIVGEAFVAHEEFLRSPVFNECLGKNDVGRLMTAALVPHGRHKSVPAIVCSFYRVPHRDGFTRSEQDAYARLLPHSSSRWKRAGSSRRPAPPPRYTAGRSSSSPRR